LRVPGVLLARCYKSTCFGSFLSPRRGTRPNRIKICSTRERKGVTRRFRSARSRANGLQKTPARSLTGRGKKYVLQMNSKLTTPGNCSFGQLSDCPTVAFCARPSHVYSEMSFLKRDAKNDEASKRNLLICYKGGIKKQKNSFYRMIK